MAALGVVVHKSSGPGMRPRLGPEQNAEGIRVLPLLPVSASVCFPIHVPRLLMIRHVQVGSYVRHFDLVFAQTLSLSITSGFIKSIRRDHAHRKASFSC